MLKALSKPFGVLLMWLYEFLGNYGLALILFALVIKLILLPFQIKSKKSSLRTAAIQPQMAELKKKHGANQQKYNEEVQKLYREEGINPMSGCLWTLIPFPILLALYYAIRYPLTTMMKVAEDALAKGGALLTKLTELNFTPTMSEAYVQIEQAQFISENFDKFSGLGVENLTKIDFTFLGMNLGQMPQWKIWTFDFSDTKTLLPKIGLFLIPVLAAVLTYLSSKIASKLTQAPETAGSMKTMNLLMPLMTLWFGFIMPAAVGLYWLANMLFGVIQDVILNKTLGKALAKEQAIRAEARRKREEELEKKRKETEALRAQNATMQNRNTSKRKQQMLERQEKDQKSAEWEKTHVKRGGKIVEIDAKEKDSEPSRVGDRKYARGRAYDPDRFKTGKTVKAKEEVSVTAEEEPAVIEEEVPAVVEETVDSEVVPEAAEAPEEEAEEEFVEESFIDEDETEENEETL